MEDIITQSFVGISEAVCQLHTRFGWEDLFVIAFLFDSCEVVHVTKKIAGLGIAMDRCQIGSCHQR